MVPLLQFKRGWWEVIGTKSTMNVVEGCFPLTRIKPHSIWRLETLLPLIQSWTKKLSKFLNESKMTWDKKLKASTWQVGTNIKQGWNHREEGKLIYQSMMIRDQKVVKAITSIHLKMSTWPVRIEEERCTVSWMMLFWLNPTS
jgi:hypothetical protein